MCALKKITVEGFKSIRSLKDFELGNLNILIGPNGAGKSNFIQVFKLLNHIVDKQLQLYVGKSGRTEGLLYFGPKVTKAILIDLRFGENGYVCKLAPAEGDTLIFELEECYLYEGEHEDLSIWFVSGHNETKLHEEAQRNQVIESVLHHLKSWVVYHFHDTSATAGVRNFGNFNDNTRLMPDASNLAASLYLLRKIQPKNYKRIIHAVRQVAPFFHDFILEPSRADPNLIQLEWRHTESDKYFNAHSLSDGTLRFMCLATLLMQEDLPSTILLDEPELGLHPLAINLLSDMLCSASKKTQVIVSTQSVTLVNQFQPEDIIVVERSKDETIFNRLDPSKTDEWIQNYGLGDLWEKNVLGGRP